jgi:hypothetical protein
MSKLEQTVPELAEEMQAFYKQVECIERNGEAVDAQIESLTLRRADISRTLGAVTKNHRKSARRWARTLDEIHSDKLYPFAVNGTNGNDYLIAGGELLVHLHADIDAFYDFTDGIEEPAPIFAMTATSGYVGHVAPGARATIENDSEFVVSIEKGIKFPSYSRRENPQEAEPTHELRIDSSNISLHGLKKVMHYGESATASWQELLLRRGKTSFEQWLAIKAASTTDLIWLSPPPEAVLRWKHFVRSSVGIILTGRFNRAESKIALAEHALTLNELDYSTEERADLEEVIRQAKLL